jgi:PLP dependent protein
MRIQSYYATSVYNFSMQKISSRLTIVEERIATAAKAYSRAPKTIQLLFATKGRSIEEIKSATASGHSLCGENYLQEALPKIAALTTQNITWHFIGPLQSNKTKLIAENFSWVQSIDRPKIAELLNQYRPANLGPLQVCIEVNISNEASKSGVKPTELLSLAQTIQKLPNLRLRGLMAIPAPSTNFKEQRTALHQVTILWQNLKQDGFALDTLSMGMSNDLEAAIAEGSTMLRIGTAIFGARGK